MRTAYFGGGTGGGGGAPTGPAGGDLGGTYPNPTVVGMHESGGPTALTIGVIPSQSLLARVGTVVQAVTLSTGLALAAGALSIVAVSNTVLGGVPVITAANAVLQSNGGGTSASWQTISGGGTPVGTGRVLTTTSPLRIAGGASADLSADRTLSVLGVTNGQSGVVPQTNGTLGQALISAAGAGSPTWGNDFGANNLVTSGNLTLGGGTVTTTGLINVAHASSIVKGRNSGNTADISVLSWGVSNNNQVILGDGQTNGSSSIWLQTTTAGGISLRFGSVIHISVSSTAAVFGGAAAGYVVLFGDTVTNAQYGYQASTASGTKNTLELVGQDGNSTGGVTAGILRLRAGNATGASGTRTGGNVELLWGTGATASGNISLGVAASGFQSMVGGMFLANSGADPTGNPSNGLYMWIKAGAGTARSSGGTVTTFAP